MDVVQRIGDLGQRSELVGPGGQAGRGAALDQLHREPAVALPVDNDDVGMIELMRELEFSSQLGDLILTAVKLVENLQRHSAIRLGGGMRPVHSGVSTTSEGGVDDITL